MKHPAILILSAALATLVQPAAGAEPLQLGASGTLTVQAVESGRLPSRGYASADLSLVWPQAQGQWVLYLEAASSVRPPAAAAVLPELNADAGSAVDADGGGRAQLSELYYQSHRWGWTLGLLDASARLDTSRLANDENLQFLAAPLVNNPTIAFPDYSPGAAWRGRLSDGLHLRALLLAADGLADTPGRSYSELLDLDAPGRGVFTAVALTHARPAGRIEIGSWLRSVRQPQLDASGPERMPWGLYLVAERTAPAGGCGTRLGLGSPAVSRAAYFGSLYCQRRHRSLTAGLGGARTWLSAQDRQPDAGDASQLETYLDWQFRQGQHLSLSAQYLVRPQFDGSRMVYDDRFWAGALRLHVAMQREGRLRDRD
jgi:hypothetical protein